MRRWRRILVPALAALPVLAVLCALGTWQVRRLHWKTDLLARIAPSERSPAAPLGAAPEPFAKAVATGRFDHAREALLGLEVRGTTLGAHLLTPLLRAGAPPLLVDRGWVPLERDRPLDRPEGEVAVTGFVRAADRRDWLTPHGRRARTALLLVRPASDRRRAAICRAARALRPGRAGRRRRAARAPCPKPRATCRGRTTRISATPSPGTAWPSRWSACSSPSPASASPETTAHERRLCPPQVPLRPHRPRWARPPRCCTGTRAP